MDTRDYGKMVHALFKNPDDILNEITADQMNLLHAVMGLAGEAAEVMDLVKKHVMTGIPLDMPKLIKELGDTEFYMEATRQAVCVDRDYVLASNMCKLSGVGGRFEHGYSDAACAARVDKEQ